MVERSLIKFEVGEEKERKREGGGEGEEREEKMMMRWLQNKGRSQK